MNVILSLIILSIPFLEFSNSNIHEINSQLIKTLISLFFVSVLLLFFINFILSKYLKKNNAFPVYILIAAGYYVFFQFNSFELLFSSSKIIGSQYLSILIIIIVFFAVFYFAHLKKNIFFLNFIKIYFTILFLFNIFLGSYNLVLNKSYLKNIKTDNYQKYSFSENSSTKSENKKNIYFVILDAAISLEMFEDIYGTNLSKSIYNIKNHKKLRYIPNTLSSFNDTGQTLGSIFNLDYVVNVDSPKITNTDIYFPDILEKKNFSGSEPPLLKELKKLDYNFYWTSNMFISCSMINEKLCLSSASKFEKNLFNRFINYYVIENFLAKSPSVAFMNKIYPNYFLNRMFYENNAIEKFLQQINHYDFSKKPHFFLIHHMIPHPPYIYDKNCNLKDNRKIINEGYKLNYLCAMKSVLKLITYIEKNDPDSVVIIQGDHGYTFDQNNKLYEGDRKIYMKELILKDRNKMLNTYKIFNSIKINKECEKYISNELDGVNAIRLSISCAANKKVELIKKQTLHVIGDEKSINYGQVIRVE